MLRSILVFLVMVSGVVIADTELTHEEIMEVLEALTAKRARAWISSGVISANHEEYRAPEIADQGDLQVEVEKAVLENSRNGVIGERLEAVPFNTRYRLGNSYEMTAKETVKVDGDKFHWEIRVDNRQDSVRPGLAENNNDFIEYFMMDWNQSRIFTWDGEKNTEYFRSINQAIVTDRKLAVNGPLTAGSISWGLGKWSYEELQKCQINGMRTDQGVVVLTISDDVASRQITLDESKGHSVTFYEYTSKISDFARIQNYSGYRLVSGRWVPEVVLIENFANDNIISRDLWTNIKVDLRRLDSEDINVIYDYDAFIRDFRFGPRPLQYRYMPPMELEVHRINVEDIFDAKVAYIKQKTGVESNCALASVWLSCNQIGGGVSFSEISDEFPISKGNTSLAEMMNALDVIEGLSACAVQTNIKSLAGLKDAKAILYLPQDHHFVNLLGINDDMVYIADMDSNRFLYKIPCSEFADLWKGVALLVSESNVEQAGELAQLDAVILSSIYGAGPCMACNMPVEAPEGAGGSCSDPNETGGICSGIVTETYSIKVCGESTSGNCENDKYIITKKETLCKFNNYDICGPFFPPVIVGRVWGCGE